MPKFTWYYRGMKFDSDHAEIYSRGVLKIPKAYNRQGLIWEKNREEGYDVIVYDWDGTILAHWTAESFLKLTEMPTLHTEWYGPNGETLDGGSLLLPDGYNWTLEEAQTFVAKNRYCDIGALYTGPCAYIWLEALIDNARWEHYGVQGQSKIDYGNGEIVDGQDFSYTYPNAGKYLVRIYGDSVNFGYYTGTANAHQSFSILGRTNPASNRSLRSNGIKILSAYLIGSKSRINETAFALIPDIDKIGLCRDVGKIAERGMLNDVPLLTHITLPPKMTSLYANVNFNYGFQGPTPSLKSISLPPGWTGYGGFNGLSSLERIIFPFPNKDNINANEFGWISGASSALKLVVIATDFAKRDDRILSRMNMFSIFGGINPDLKVYVPEEYYDSVKTKLLSSNSDIGPYIFVLEPVIKS